LKIHHYCAVFKMTKNSKIPNDYKPFPELIICSNSFVNGKIPIEVSGNIPFLVGNGKFPIIWLFGPVSKYEIKWQEIVSNNQALDKRITITFSEKDQIVNVSFGSIILIQVKKISDDKADIINLDLRPLGLNIYGDSNGLNVGTNSFSNNSFSNVNTMLALT
jgi:hypothetical protein